MKRNTKVAQAFVAQTFAKLGNAETDGKVYWLFGHPICRDEGAYYEFNWCGHWTQSTARHINFILGELRAAHRVSYAQARDADIEQFIVKK